ncbi:hypothetical protein J1N35_013882 [Gossypium stocksii]|uniref:Uncharacterized protein n=1 Tax=Gossypium stocksii TaxID=47602 RepID=A0A9D3VVM5_9ROSI|nr:hypothetical protein J1N35_013882 [Gossypium stocksii]
MGADTINLVLAQFAWPNEATNELALIPVRREPSGVTIGDDNVRNRKKPKTIVRAANIVLSSEYEDNPQGELH